MSGAVSGAVSGAPALLVTLGLLAGLAVLLWPPASAQGHPSRRPDRPTPRRGEGRRRRGTSSLGDRLRRLRRRRSGDDLERQEVQLLDGLAAALDAGLATEHALRVVLEPPAGSRDPAEPARPWAELARGAREGQPLAPAWSRLARRTGSRTAASVARAWAVAGATGAPLAAAVRSSAHAARERHRLERAVEVATAGARATATVLGLLPLGGVGLAALLGVGPGALYGDPLALLCAGLGLVLLAGGHLAVRRMVRGVLAGVR